MIKYGLKLSHEKHDIKMTTMTITSSSVDF